MDLFKIIIILFAAVIVIVIIIYSILMNSNNTNVINIDNGNAGEKIMEKAKYIKISASQMVEETKSMSKEDYVILDVRTKVEYEEERIINSALLTLDEIESKAAKVLPNKDIKIYVYCRSGRRSLEAAYKLIDLGYNKVYDFGGIIDYPYEKLKQQNK